MLKKLLFIKVLFLSICCVGCDNTDPKLQGKETLIDFQIALRNEGVVELPEENAGTFNVISKHEIPVHIGMENEEVTSVEQGIWLDIRWTKSELKGGRLWLLGIQYRIRNKMFYNGSGGGMGWASVTGFGLSSDWNHLNSRVSLSPTKSGPLLYHRIRWLSPSRPIPDIEMTEIVQRATNHKS